MNTKENVPPIGLSNDEKSNISNFAPDSRKNSETAARFLTDTKNQKEYRIISRLKGCSFGFGEVYEVQCLLPTKKRKLSMNCSSAEEDKTLPMVNYAIKCVEISNNELKSSLQRDISVMLKLKPDNNVLHLFNYFIDDSILDVQCIQRLCMVLPMYETDLAFLLHAKTVEKSAMSVPELDIVQNIMRQMLNGLLYIHKEWNIIHCNLHPENILIQNYGQPNMNVLIASFRRSCDLPSECKYDDDNHNENNETLTVLAYIVMYRAPELLVGEMQYGCAIDIWALGCIFAQMCREKSEPLFKRNNDIPQLLDITKVLGGPPSDSLVGVGHYDDFLQFKEKAMIPMRDIIDKEHLNDSGCHLLQEMMNYNHKQRITAEQALKHPFFHGM